jgi:hypothetical protein
LALQDLPFIASSRPGGWVEMRLTLVYGMKFFSQLLKRFKPLEIDDALFGRLVYMKMPKGRTSYWEAKCQFSPCGREIELFIDAPDHEQAPNERQREFFFWVERGYSTIIANIEGVLRSQFEKWTRHPLSKPFEKEFRLTSFSVPLPGGESMKWEMSFESETDADHLFTVCLYGAEAQSVSIDG